MDFDLKNNFDLKVINRGFDNCSEILQVDVPGLFFIILYIHAVPISMFHLLLFLFYKYVSAAIASFVSSLSSPFSSHFLWLFYL